MEKIDFRKAMPTLFKVRAGEFADVVAPPMQFIKVDGHGDPNHDAAYRRAVEWLYPMAYGIKFAAKARLGKDYVVPPLEGLWWADDPRDFVERRKSRWHWTMMIITPDFVDASIFEDVLAKVRAKSGEAPDSSRLEALNEGRCLQTLHVGSYDDEGPILARLHAEIMPSLGLTFSGPHHEIYLSDARRTAPDKLKTILRQPVRPVGQGRRDPT